MLHTSQHMCLDILGHEVIDAGSNVYIAKCQHGRVHQRWVTNARDSTISPLMAPKLCVSVLPIPQVGVMASANVELGLCTDLAKEHRWFWKGVGGAGFGQLVLASASDLCMTAKSPTFGANVAMWSCELSAEGTQATFWHSVSWSSPKQGKARAHAHGHAAVGGEGGGGGGGGSKTEVQLATKASAAASGADDAPAAAAAAAAAAASAAATATAAGGGAPASGAGTAAPEAAAASAARRRRTNRRMLRVLPSS